MVLKLISGKGLNKNEDEYLFKGGTQDGKGEKTRFRWYWGGVVSFASSLFLNQEGTGGGGARKGFFVCSLFA